jgi:polyisoprenyl-teichoic acid--peptidoglycan teichoic acid transferase
MTLDLNFGLQIDNYVTVNMFTLEKIIDAVDGIDVYLPYNVDGKSTLEEDPFDLGYFEKGYHHLNGETAVSLARIRLVDDVFHRANRQSLVLYGLQEKLLNPAVLPRIPKLIMAFEDSVKTNLSALQIRQLTCLAPHINRHNLTMTNLPRDLFTAATIEVENYTKPVFVWSTDYEVIQQLLDLFQNGFWPQ